MPFISTRGHGGAVTAAEAILQGLASDGGLFMPERLPKAHLGTDYAQIAAELLIDAFGESFSSDSLRAMAQRAYASGRFQDEAVCPLQEVGGHLMLELFHGPTASFKDLALSILPPLMAAAREQLMPDREILVLTATSGDTGSATMAGFRDRPGIKVIVFYPKNGVSPVQAAQMQRMSGDNLKAVAILGDFDQAQQGVKAIFREAESIAPHLLLSSANSINIGRLIPQMAHYLDAWRRLGKDQAPPVFSVPTGNFGDIFAGLLCKEAGMPAERLLCATNDNRVLADALQSGIYDRRRKLVKTLSPSMDILVSSNFERALYLMSGSDTALVSDLMKQLEEDGQMWIQDALLQALRRHIRALSHGDAGALKAIREVWLEHGYLMDPHTAAAWLALQVYQKESGSKARGVVLSTASPYKFPKAVLIALGQPVPESAEEQLMALRDFCDVPMPAGLQGLFDQPIIHDEVISPDAMADYVREKARQW